MVYAFLGSIIVIWWALAHISSQISTQTEAITNGIRSLKDVLEKEESTDYTSLIKYDANDIYNLIEDFPEKIAKEIKCELGYSRDELMGLAYDIRDIKGSLIDIEKELTDIRARMPD